MQQSRIRKPLSILLSILMVLSVFGGMAFTASAVPADIDTPLTLEAKASAVTVTVNNAPSGMQYSKNGGAKQPYTEPVSLTQGETLQLYGSGTSITSYGSSDTRILCDDECCIYGNVMSLVDEFNFSTADSVGEYAFKRLFYRNDKICNHETRDLVLPAATLGEECYHSMFQGCSNLTRAPELPAETLARSCYGSMFYKCTSLTQAPERLPAAILAINCYYCMFRDCSNLTRAPELPAETLTNYCYFCMFQGCTSLNAVICLATDLSANNATSFWLEDVSSTGTFTRAKNVEWASGIDGIPTRWTVANWGRVIDLGTLTADFEAQDDDILTGTLAGDYQITAAAGATITLRDADITCLTANAAYAGINPLGDLTILLEGANTVKGGQRYMPGIYVPENTTLTIDGTGSLVASSGGNFNDESPKAAAPGIGAKRAPGIGRVIAGGSVVINGGVITANGGNGAAGVGGCASRAGNNLVSFGDIAINGGAVTATGRDGAPGIGSGNNTRCGNITITGGTVTATGDNKAAGIGGGYSSYGRGACGDITIADTVTLVTATKGENADYSVGAVENALCGTITVGGAVVGPIAVSPFVYPTPYTVTWKNGTTVLETDANLAYGAAASYDGETPTKDATAQYTYAFSGWTDGENTYGLTDPLPYVTGDVIYTATFSTTTNTYTVTWKNGDDPIEIDEGVAYGTSPSFDGTAPAKAADTYYTYAFSGWRCGDTTYGLNDTLPPVTGDATYTATFTPQARTFMIMVKKLTGATINVYDVTGETTVAQVKEMVADEAGIPASEQRLIFAGKTLADDKTLSEYNVQKESTLHVIGKVHTITWLNDDSTLIDTTSLSYGAVPTHDDPTKEATAKYTYFFDGWTDGENTYEPDALPAVTVNVTFTAVFESIVNEYTVTWEDELGNPIEIDDVPYGETPSYDGETPTKDADAVFTYYFCGWTDGVNTYVPGAPLPSVTGEVTYTAVFESTDIVYTVTWKNGDEPIEIDENVFYGETPSYDGETPTKDATAQYIYTFSGWTDGEYTYGPTDDLPVVTGNITYTAMFSTTTNTYTYTVTWKNGDDPIETDENVPYGTAPSYDGETPTKDATAQYIYAFSGWTDGENTYGLTDTLPAVIANVTYTATFTETVNQAAIDAAAAAAVDEKIEAIGEVTLDSKDAIDEARAAYDALTGDQQALVNKLDDLTAAEEAYAALAAAAAELEEAFEEYRESLLTLAEALRKDGDSEAVTALIDEAVAALTDYAYDETKTLAENQKALEDILYSYADAVKSQRKTERQDELNRQPCSLCGQHHTGSLLENLIGIIHGMIWIMRSIALITA